MTSRPHRLTGLAVAIAALTLVRCDAARELEAEAPGSGAAGACTTCHGDATRAEADALLQAAPPRTATSAGAGAHAAHLHGGAVRGPIACAECHAVPGDPDHSNGAVDLAFGPLASKSPAAPERLPDGSCAVYCHGVTLGGGPAASPAWTSTTALGCTSCHGYPPPSHDASATHCSSCHGGTIAPGGDDTVIDVAGGLHVNGSVDAAGGEAACGTCHGIPPPAPHTASTACGSCHAGYTATTVNPTTHRNGSVQVTGSQHPASYADAAQHGHEANRIGLSTCKGCHGSDLAGGAGPSCSTCHANAGTASWATSCTFCHGDRAAARPSPPLDTQGGASAANVSVGVHASHVGTAIANPIACAECHPARAASVVTDTAHVDGDARAEVQFGTLARTGGATPAYSRTSATTATCASTYCHGNFGGGARATVSWTSTTQVTCTSCHGTPPSSGDHGRHSGRSCGDCHPGYTRTAVNAATHLNGTKQVGNRITAWDPATRRCTGCHGADTW